MYAGTYGDVGSGVGAGSGVHGVLAGAAELGGSFSGRSPGKDCLCPCDLIVGEVAGLQSGGKDGERRLDVTSVGDRAEANEASVAVGFRESTDSADGVIGVQHLLPKTQTKTQSKRILRKVAVEMERCGRRICDRGGVQVDWRRRKQVCVDVEFAASDGSINGLHKGIRHRARQSQQRSEGTMV